MDQSIKQRLVGIAVIFALAVIFLPMILDGSGVKNHQIEVSIPAQPVVSGNVDFSEQISELKIEADAIPDIQPRYVDENSTATIKRTEKKPTETATKLSSSPPELKNGGESWVLQVASFTDEKKALVQRDKLRRSKISAVFIEAFDIKGKTSYRVRLGPFLSKSEVKVAQNKVKAKHDIDGLVMKYER
ncbi:MAG: DedD protein [Gammaproteobacteria bacterium]|jgi:DedD protein